MMGASLWLTSSQHFWSCLLSKQVVLGLIGWQMRSICCKGSGWRDNPESNVCQQVIQSVRERITYRDATLIIYLLAIKIFCKKSLQKLLLKVTFPFFFYHNILLLLKARFASPTEIHHQSPFIYRECRITCTSAICILIYSLIYLSIHISMCI